jgi:hypothetical protein
MKIIKNILFTLMFMLLASSVFAASFTVSDLNFGSENQLRGQDTTTLLHIVNDGTEALTLTLSSTISSDYNIRFSQSTLTLATNTSSDVTVTIFVPESQTSSKTLLSGNIVVTSTNVAGLSKTVNSYLTTKSMLDISKVTIEIDGDEHTLREDETYSDSDILKPGTSFSIIVYVKNTFSSSQDVDIENVDVDIRGSDDLDLDDSDDIGDLQYGDKESISFSSEIPSDAEDGDDYDIDIVITGRDENGVLYEDTFSTSIEVEKESHEILINSATLSPKTVSLCTNNKVTLNVDLENSGKYNENRVALTIVNDDLGISQKFYPIDLDRDDITRKTYSFTIPNSTLPGSYDLLVTSYYDSDEMSLIELVSLDVTTCQTTTSNINKTNSNSNADNSNIQQQILPVVNTNGATPVYGTASFADSTVYITLLIIAVVVMVIILIILLVKFVF